MRQKRMKDAGSICHALLSAAIVQKDGLQEKISVVYYSQRTFLRNGGGNYGG